MFHLREAVENAGLQIVDLQGSEACVPLVADHFYHSSVIARYLFLYSNAVSWRAAATDPSLEQMIQRLYFAQRSDLSWNLYLVVVLDPDEFANISMYEKLEFLRDTEFTRKMIVPADRFSDMIPLGRIITQEPDEEALLPMQNWQDALASAGLSTVWLDKPNEQILNQFLEAGVDRGEKRTAAPFSASQGQDLREIQSVTIPREFRPHCYDREWTLTFPKISLFYGPNGVGKTSILEAIEFAMTGEIRKSPGNPSGLDHPVTLRAMTDFGETTVSSDLDLPERKRREQEWYACHPNPWERSRLSQLFHTYNQFSVEDVYLYARGGGQPEYSQRFSQMLFGNEASVCQKHWQEYAKDAEKKQREYEQEIKKLETELDSLECRPTVERETLAGYLAHSDFNFEVDDPAFPHAVRAAVERVKPLYDKLSWSGESPSPDQIPALIKKAEGEIINLQERLEAKRKETTERVIQLEDACSLETKVHEQQEKLYQQLTQLAELAAPMDLLQFLAHNPDFQDQYGQARENLSAAQQLWSHYIAFSDRFQDLKTCTESEERLTQAEADHRLLTAQKDDLDQELQVQTQLVRKAKETADALHETTAMIRSAGLKYWELLQDIEQCPLCGSQVTHNQILHHLNAAVDVRSSELSDLMCVQQELQVAYNQLEEEVRQAETRIRLSHRYQEAWQYIQQTGLDALLPEQRPPVIISQIRTLFTLESQVKQQYHMARAELSRLWELLGPGKQLGTIETFPADLAAACQSIEQALQAIGIQPADGSPSALCSAILSVRKQWTGSRLQADLDAGTARNEITRLEGIVSRLRSEVQQLTQRINTRKDDLHELKLLQDLWGQASPYLKPEVCRQGRLDWGKQLPELQRLAADSIEEACLAETVRKLQARIAALRCQQENALRLQNALRSLRPLEDHAEKFIQRHLAQISNIFLQLHTPQEYVRLELRTVGHREELFAVRNTDSEDMIPLQEMSTGQQTSVVLSVLLEMHLSMRSVPHFLLIDEPVSNIDDLNILSMLDLFRELVISQNQQLFVTTASQNVAKLFRRKFSFLKEDYAEFSIKRSEEMQVVISKRQYDQNGILNCSEV